MTRNETQLTWQQLRDLDVEGNTHSKKRVKPLTPNQARYIKALDTSTVTLCVGPAGTGKTHIACGKGAEWLKEGKVAKVVITRPLVSCSGRNGQGVGFLPGGLEEKISPYMRPLLDAFGEFFSPSELEELIRTKCIEMWPLDLMRGASIKKAFIICDEAQNAEYEQLYMALTRFGQDSRMVLTGDDSSKQTDLRGGAHPFREVLSRFEKNLHKDISIVRLGREDICRHPLIQWIDERLSGDGLDGQGETDESWFQFVCPGCKTKLWYSDPQDQVDYTRCYSCAKHVKLWKDNQFNPSLTKAVTAASEVATTYPERP